MSNIPVAREKFFEEITSHLKKTRPLIKLAEKGIDNEFFPEYEEDLNTAKGFKTDEELKKELGIFTVDKDRKLEIVYNNVKNVYFFMEQKYKGKPEMNELPKNPSKLAKDESLMIDTFPLIQNTFERHKAELKAPAEFSDALTAGINDLKAANEAQEAKKDANKIYTKQRKAAYLKVLEKMKQVNKAGKLAYADDPITLSLFENPWPDNNDKDDNKPEDPQNPPPGE